MREDDDDDEWQLFFPFPLSLSLGPIPFFKIHGFFFSSSFLSSTFIPQNLILFSLSFFPLLVQCHSRFQDSRHHLSFIHNLHPSSSHLVFFLSFLKIRRQEKGNFERRKEREKMSLYYRMRNSFHSVNFNQLFSLFTFNPIQLLWKLSLSISQFLHLRHSCPSLERK